MSTDDEEKRDVVLRLLNDGSITISEAYLLLGNSDMDIIIEEEEIEEEPNEESTKEDREKEKEGLITDINEIISNMKAIADIDQSKVFDPVTGFCKN
jgi:hypothetical protein